MSLTKCIGRKGIVTEALTEIFKYGFEDLRIFSLLKSDFK